MKYFSVVLIIIIVSIIYLKMNWRLCVVPGCFNRSKMYHLPSNEETQKVWLQRIGNAKLYNLASVQSQTICEMHFDADCFHDNGKLKKFSLPTLNLPGYQSCHLKKDIFLYLHKKKEPTSEELREPTIIRIGSPELRVNVPTKTYGRKRAREEDQVSKEMEAPNTSQINLMTEFYEQQKAKLDEVLTEVEALKKENVSLKEKICELERKFDALERKGKAENIVISGVPRHQSENTNRIMKNIGKVLNISLTSNKNVKKYRIGKQEHAPMLVEGLGNEIEYYHIDKKTKRFECE